MGKASPEVVLTNEMAAPHRPSEFTRISPFEFPSTATVSEDPAAKHAVVSQAAIQMKTRAAQVKVQDGIEIPPAFQVLSQDPVNPRSGLALVNMFCRLVEHGKSFRTSS